MNTWPQYPSVYEINTWIWLDELSRKYRAPVDLVSVPPSEWDDIESFGFDAVWLMGVWERSPAGIAIANRNEGLLADFRRALPDFRLGDNVGSPYCVRDYSVDPHLGGPGGLAIARRELARRGMRLILDFVPNHVAPDHPWVLKHPEYFVCGTREDLRDNPASYMANGDNIFACGRDPYFPAWPDVLQLNAFKPGLRRAVRETLSVIASQCDGIRCDMAMLLLNNVFSRTWGERVGPALPTEYWQDVIPSVKDIYPHFLFIAEAYWDLEWELQQKGFDFCYDKRLYDRLEHDNAESVRLHLCAGTDYQDKLLRFLENHDEPRAASVFEPGKHRAAAVVSAALSGARLFHEGQFEGRKVRVPVFLGRRPFEPPDQELQAFYTDLLTITNAPAFRKGEWSLCDCSGWANNQTCRNLLAWAWGKDECRYLIVVNLSAAAAQGHVRIPFGWPKCEQWRLHDALSGGNYQREGHEFRAQGLYVDLAPWGCHFLECEPQWETVAAQHEEQYAGSGWMA
jgi:hypothetical protein